MAINATTDSKPKELIPAGLYVARCYKMIHIGTVESVYMGQVKKLNKVRIGFELPTEMKVFKPENGEQPIVIEKEYTLSMYEKANLRKDLASWRGKDFTEDEAKSFDITKLVGKQCMLNIIHKASEKDKSKVYEQVTGITPLPKGMTCPEQINPTFVLSYDEWSDDKFKTLPEFIRKAMVTSDEYKAMENPSHNEVASTDNADDSSDLPF